MHNKEGKKNRKYARNFRRLCQKRYIAEERWIKNKINRILHFVNTHHNYKCFAMIEGVRHKFFFNTKTQKACWEKR